MNTNLFTLAIAEILIALTVSVSVLFLSFQILKKIFFKNISFAKDNLAFVIFSSGIIISIGFILSEIIPSISNIIRIAMNESDGIPFAQILKYSGLYLLIGFLIALVINAVTFLLFSVLTKSVNEFQEIKNNNTAVALLIAAILVAITMILKDSIALLMSSMMPFQEVTNFL